MTGTIKFFKSDKRYGFIGCDDHEHSDVFFHAKRLAKGYTPITNDRVEFDTMPTARGLEACNIIPI